MQRVLSFLLLLAMVAPCMADCPELTAAQTAIGYITLTNMLMTAGYLLAGAGVCFIFSGIIKQALSNKHLVEFVVWACVLAGMASGLVLDSGTSHWSVFSGSVGLMGALALSAHIRNIAPDPNRLTTTLLIVWSGLAVGYQYTELGFIAVAAFVSLIGFSTWASPLSIAVGFKSDDSTQRGTLGGFVITAIYVTATMQDMSLGVAGVFQTGALWIGSFVWFLGMLLMSSRWYWNTSSIVGMNMLMVGSLAGTLYLSAVYGLRELTTIAAAFTVLYAVDKVLEVRTHDYILVGVKLIIAGGLLYAVWQYAIQHQAELTKYLTI